MWPLFGGLDSRQLRSSSFCLLAHAACLPKQVRLEQPSAFKKDPSRIALQQTTHRFHVLACPFQGRHILSLSSAATLWRCGTPLPQLRSLPAAARVPLARQSAFVGAQLICDTHDVMLWITGLAIPPTTHSALVASSSLSFSLIDAAMSPCLCSLLSRHRTSPFIHHRFIHPQYETDLEASCHSFFILSTSAVRRWTSWRLSCMHGRTASAETRTPYTNTRYGQYQNCPWPQQLCL